MPFGISFRSKSTAVNTPSMTNQGRMSNVQRVPGPVAQTHSNAKTLRSTSGNVHLNSKQTPENLMIYHIKNQNIDAIKEMLSKGFDFTQCEKNVFLICFDSNNPEIVSAVTPFVDLGHKVSLTDGTPITYNELAVRASKPNPALLTAFINSHPDLDRLYDGRTLLSKTIEFGTLENLNLLLNKGVNVNNTSCFPLLWAMAKGSVDHVHTLIAAGCDPSTTIFFNNTHKSALEHLIDLKNPHSAQNLVASGLIKFTDTYPKIIENGNGPLLRAFVGSSNRIKNSVIENIQANQEIVNDAIEKSDGKTTDLIRVYIDLGVNHTLRDSEGDLPIHTAIIYNKLDVLDLLLKADPESLHCHYDPRFIQPLDYAVKLLRWDCAHRLFADKNFNTQLLGSNNKVDLVTSLQFTKYAEITKPKLLTIIPLWMFNAWSEK